MKTKKYRIVPILITVFIMLSSCAKKTDWDLYELKGKVKSYTENYYKPVEKFGKWQEGKSKPFGNYSVRFTEKGDYEQMDFFDENNELRERMISKKENGKIVAESKYDGDGKFLGKTTYTYPSAKKIEFVSYEPDGEEVATGKTYLKNGKVVRRDFKTLYNGKVEHEIRMKFLYDENGMSSGIEQKYPEGDVKTTRFEYVEFDKQNNWIKRLDFDSEDNKTPENVVIRTYEYY